MAIELRGVGTHATKEGSGNAVPGLPAGWQPTDVHVLVAISSRNDAIPIPGDWTSLVSQPDAEGVTDLTVRIAWRRAQEGDSAPSIACTTGNSLSCRIAGFSGARLEGDPWEDISDGHDGEGNPIETPGIGTTFACAILYAALTDNDFSFSGWALENGPALSEVFDSPFNASAAKDSTIGLAWGHQDKAGATGSGTVAQAEGVTTGVGYLLALIPEGAEPEPEGPWEGDELEDFEIQEAVEGRISVSEDVVCPGTTHNTTFKFDCRQGEFVGGDVEDGVNRAEIYADQPPFVVAEEVTRWYRWQTRFHPDYDTSDTEGFRTIMQFKHTDDSGAPADLYTIGDEIRWGSLFGPQIATVEPGVWYDFELEAVWSHDAEDALQRLFLNGEQVGELNVPLVEGEGIYLKWGLYKDGEVPSGIIYHGGLVCAETREELGEPYSPPGPELPSGVVVNREFPPTKHCVIVRDPKSGAPISRWAEDEGRSANVMNGLRLSGAIPGGRKELRCTLPRNPRQDWPDIEGFLEIEAQLPGRNRVWHGRIGKAPRSDGERMVIEGEAVGYAAALEDRKALRIGFIDPDLSKWGEGSTQRKIEVISFYQTRSVEASVGFQDTGATAPSIIFRLSYEDGHPLGEMWYHGGGVPLGALGFDYNNLSGALEDFHSFARISNTDLGTGTNASSSDQANSSSSAQWVNAVGSQSKYAYVHSYYEGPYTGEGTDSKAWTNLRVLSKLAKDNLQLQGIWPNVGYSAAQMLRLAVPEYSELEATEESVEDDGFIIHSAWFADPGTLARVVDELVRYGLYDWFVKDGKRFELRAPGSYGRRWQAYQGPSNFQEAGSDTERAWDRIVVAYRDPDGSTRYVGWPGSGCEVESEQLQITDPDHPAVRAGTVREDLLDLGTESTATRAIEVGERWLAEANELSRSGSARLAGYVQDDRGVFHPAAVVAEGDLLRFPDARDKSYRKIVGYEYSADELAVDVQLDAPSEGVKALLERFRAVLAPFGLR